MEVQPRSSIQPWVESPGQQQSSKTPKALTQKSCINGRKYTLNNVFIYWGGGIGPFAYKNEILPFSAMVGPVR